MKKVILAVTLAFLSLTFVPVQTMGANINNEPATTIPASKPAENAETKALMTRLNEINAMDKSKMNSTEKKKLRKEVKSIKSRMKDISGGVYISGAALIIIVVLLLVLL
jgi:hypothetical protein